MFDHVSDQGVGVGLESVTDGRMLGLWYDPDRLIIEGVYCDEVTAYRARRRWIEALKMHFLLDEGLDFSLKVKLLRVGSYFKVQCVFLTACGRYAFWRLTNHQALEVQCILETAHLPRPLCVLSSHSEIDDGEEMTDAELDQFRVCRTPTGDSGAPEVQGTWFRAMRAIQFLAQRLVSLTRN